ncbi:WecB/TagA/CpsF family glycosyltransferase [Roseibium litorale]|uniref:WecB/TagA/CpsF family glycosyltransferase n=1 Tax=Roseibium litorale TaxID=2803841 RepID=A0ABR9CP33_9HYPH|nr:WecB/TagA/CpsF family glycosyltransferase [Roseibium litorale]MBD8892419.1 WecB/TagA/CpsF family glycosyltransferase [Roseibium litorale]
MAVKSVEADHSIRDGSFRFGSLEILRLDLPEALNLVRSAVLDHRRTDIAICNAHTALTALETPEYETVLRSMTLLNDGIGIEIAARWLSGRGFPANLNGTDFVPQLLGKIGVPLRIYLLGAKEEQLRLAARHISETYPLHTVVGMRNGYFGADETDVVCKAISAVQPDLLLVAMGNPRQEQFIVANRDRLGVTVTIGVGALLDFMSGTILRAPDWMRALGLEWLFRLAQEPRRLFRRYVIGIPKFLWAVRRLKKTQQPAA